MIIFFVERGKLLFGERFCIYNVHSLLHLVDDVKEYGPLNENSSFKYENYLQNIKRMIRSGKCPLAQIINRLDEYNDNILLKPKYINSRINIKNPNNYYYLKDLSFCQIIECIEEDKILCKIYKANSFLSFGSFDLCIIGCRIVDHSCFTIQIININVLHGKYIGISNIPFYLNKIIFLKLHH